MSAELLRLFDLLNISGIKLIPGGKKTFAWMPLTLQLLSSTMTPLLLHSDRGVLQRTVVLCLLGKESVSWGGRCVPPQQCPGTLWCLFRDEHKQIDWALYCSCSCWLTLYINDQREDRGGEGERGMLTKSSLPSPPLKSAKVKPPLEDVLWISCRCIKAHKWSARLD